jgi:glycosyltransferase involved in cell wall biosynthesis
VESSDVKRIAVVASHVIQYQDPFFKLLASDAELDVTVLYCSRAGLDDYRDSEMQTTLRWDLDLLHGYRSIFMRNFGHGDGYMRLINPGVVRHITSGRYDAVIFMLGWGSITSLLGVAACRASNTPFFFYGDSSHPPAATTFGGRVRARLLRSLFGITDGFLVSGVLNADYYAHYGASRDRFFLLPWAIDNERFKTASRFEPAEREAMRARFGIRPGDLAIVYSAKLLPRKDPMTLLRAFARMQHRDRAALIFLGNGELREQLERFVRDEGLERVVLAGFVNQTELPKHYAMADVFVLPSTYEPRGAVINEAMACGLPVIVTDRCGSIGDLVQDGENAFIYPAGDAEQLAKMLDRLSEDEPLRARMAQRSREIIDTWDFARGVEGVKEALRWLPRRS